MWPEQKRVKRPILWPDGLTQCQPSVAWAAQGPSGVVCHFTRLAFPEEVTARAGVHEIKAHNHRMVGGGGGGARGP